VRILVAAPFPPAPDEAAATALRTVQRLLAEGHDVEVISPLPSAADRQGPLAGIAGALLLARLAHRFDALHLVVSRRMLFRPERPMAGRLLDGAAMAMALRLWRRSSADLADLRDVPGGGGGLSGRLVWGALQEIFVTGEPVRNHAIKVLHFPAGKVSVLPAGRDAGASPGAAGGARVGMPPAGLSSGRHDAPTPVLPAWRAESPVGWTEILTQVRARAALERERLAGAPAGNPGAVPHHQ
jgi:hypothetical protein